VTDIMRRELPRVSNTQTEKLTKQKGEESGGITEGIAIVGGSSLLLPHDKMCIQNYNPG